MGSGLRTKDYGFQTWSEVCQLVVVVADVDVAPAHTPDPAPVPAVGCAHVKCP